MRTNHLLTCIGGHDVQGLHIITQSGPSGAPPNISDDFKSVLELSCWKDVCMAQHLLGGACLGLGRKISVSFNSDYRGQLVSLRCIKGLLVLEAIDPDGSIRPTHRLRFCRRPTGGGPLALEVEEIGSGEGPGQWEWVRETMLSSSIAGGKECGGYTLSRRHESPRTYVPLTGSAPEWGALERHLDETGLKSMLAQLCGVWKGNYGPHGKRGRSEPSLLMMNVDNPSAAGGTAGDGAVWWCGARHRDPRSGNRLSGVEGPSDSGRVAAGLRWPSERSDYDATWLSAPPYVGALAVTAEGAAHGGTQDHWGLQRADRGVVSWQCLPAAFMTQASA